MSAANRGAKRIEADNYPTPSWATRRILDALRGRLGTLKFWEPCVGEGAIAKVISEMFPGAMVIGSDVRETSWASGGAMWDATKPIEYISDGRPGFDLLITNPPFNVAHEIIQAQRNAAPLCCYLLRASFLEGERTEAYRDDMPDEYRLPERPNFVASMKCKTRLPDGRRIDGCGWRETVAIDAPRFVECPECGSKELQCSTTDASAYSWFVWGTTRRSVGETRILPSTPLAERQRA